MVATVSTRKARKSNPKPAKTGKAASKARKSQRWPNERVKPATITIVEAIPPALRFVRLLDIVERHYSYSLPKGVIEVIGIGRSIYGYDEHGERRHLFDLPDTLCCFQIPRSFGRIQGYWVGQWKSAREMEQLILSSEAAILEVMKEFKI